MNLTTWIAAGMLAFAVPLAASAQTITERVKFERGTSGTVINDRITGDEAVDYLLGVSAGQTMEVTLTTDNGSNAFNITAPGARQALFIGSTDGNAYRGVIPSSGDYRISVYLIRNAARRGESANYALSIRVLGASTRTVAPQPQQPAPDFADGLMGGPDFWQVAGLTAGDTLNLRADASTRAQILGRYYEGQVFRNFGCKMAGGQRWCQVQPPEGGPKGWVAGRYLQESAYTDAAPRQIQPVQRAPAQRSGPTATAKCSASPDQCFNEAAAMCGGSYAVIDSESHAGGLLGDSVPGPVTWYVLTYRCGPPSNRQASFPFRGPRYTAPSPNGRSTSDSTVSRNDMQAYCRGEAAQAFGERPQNIVTLPVEDTGGGYIVPGQYPPDGEYVTTFQCTFGADGTFISVYAN